MTADSVDELHAFAREIGLKRCWFHRGTNYDLTANKRQLAVRHGAQQITARELVRRVEHLRGRGLREEGGLR